jgi:prepilin-type N-terminal cleavage/methylation domain-containing protein
MKTHQKVESRKSNVERRQNNGQFFRPRPSALDPRQAFTLIELLVVISIIGILAAFTIPVAHAVKKYQYISQTKAEMGKLTSAIDSYKNACGFYPPSNPAYPGQTIDCMFSPLYYELLGTTNSNPANPDNGTYYPLDGSAGISSYNFTNACGVGGIVNCTKGSGEDALPAKNFLAGLKPNQFGIYSNNNAAATILLGSAGGPDLTYSPLTGAPGVNPWRYVSPGVNNPNSYDLWMQLSIGGKTYLVCNWSSQQQVGSPLP